jgi:hypothetical protein
MEPRKVFVPYDSRPSRKGPGDNACPKCKADMQDFDGPDIKGVNHRGKLCPRCNYFIGVRSTTYSHKRGKFDKNAKMEEEYKGRIRPKRERW